MGTLNPDLYKNENLEGDVDNFPDDHIGRVWFYIDYQAEAEKLLITLIKIKNLPSRSAGSVNCCNPYVR